MATIKQYKYNWRNPITGIIESDGINVLKSTKGIIKAGIQAPPGTKFEIYLNNESFPFTVIIGKNGILELEYDDIIINQIKIIPQIQYIKDQVQTESEKNAAIAKINNAILNYENSAGNQTLQSIEALAVTVTQAYMKFFEAVQGIYMDNSQQIAIENVLIDYIEED